MMGVNCQALAMTSVEVPGAIKMEIGSEGMCAKPGSKKSGHTPEDRAGEIKGALDWMRNNGVSPGGVDAVEKFIKAGPNPIFRRSPEQRTKDCSDALHWMGSKGTDDKVKDPTSEFRKMDSILPKSTNNQMNVNLLPTTNIPL
jgi:hypothetical protein